MKIHSLVFLLLFPFLFSCKQAVENPKDSHLADNLQTKKTGTANIVFKSADGGETWQDISKGLTENIRVDSIRGNSLFANDKGLFVRVGNGFYHNTPNATPPFWTKEIFTGEDSSLVPGKPGKPYWGVNLKSTNGTSVWSPVFETFQERLRSVFETAGGSIFIALDRGIIRSTDMGKTWKLVYAGGPVGNLAESDGVLLATSMRKIIRSTDNGETWAPVISEDSVAWDVKPIKGGFAAMTSGSESGTRRLSTSYDGGKTWQSIHSRLQDKVVIDSIRRTWNDRINDRLRRQTFIASIIKIGKNFFGTHTKGIFRSSDNGKTWKLLLPAVDGQVFRLFVSGNVIYAIPGKGGC
ncbi:MAG TPA: hypothetical protein PKC72_13410 [Chitinophagaceae bacterium]|nr:hypothetical protein [Chitinophagaceae bacterium]